MPAATTKANETTASAKGDGGSPRRRRRITDRGGAMTRAALAGALVAGLGLGVLDATGVIRRDDSDEGASAGTDRDITVTVSGDLLWHETVYESGMTADGGWDFSEVFAPMKRIISTADLGICHEEVPFAPSMGPFTGYPEFQAPPQIAEGVKEAGWDLCTTASNHSVDYGYDGIARTMGAFEKAGIVTSGTARSAEEDATPRIAETDSGVRIGVVSGTYGTNGRPVDHPWMVQGIDPDELLDKAKATRDAGADIVMVAVHAGEEGVNEPTGQQEELARILTASPYVDVVYGHHVHTVQPIEKVNGKWVVYGLGNFIAAQEPDNILAYEGLTVRFTFSPSERADEGTADGAGGDDGTPGANNPKPGWRVSKLEYIPTIISSPELMPVTTYPISELLGDADANLERIRASRARTVATVLSRGAGSDPMVREA